MKLETKQINFFKIHGYLKLKNILPKKIFDDIQKIISPWVDDKIQNWINEGLISKDYSELDFLSRVKVPLLNFHVVVKVELSFRLFLKIPEMKNESDKKSHHIPVFCDSRSKQILYVLSVFSYWIFDYWKSSFSLLHSIAS